MVFCAAQHDTAAQGAATHRGHPRKGAHRLRPHRLLYRHHHTHHPRRHRRIRGPSYVAPRGQLDIFAPTSLNDVSEPPSSTTASVLALLRDFSSRGHRDAADLVVLSDGHTVKRRTAPSSQIGLRVAGCHLLEENNEWARPFLGRLAPQSERE